MQGRDRARAGSGAAHLLLAALLTLSIAACSGSDQGVVDQSRFAARLAARHHITADQARCATRSMYRALSSEEVRTIYDDGLGRISPARWTFYLQAMVGCVLADGEGS